MDNVKQTQAANDDNAADTMRLCSRKTDIKAALLARRLHRERLNHAIELLLRAPANGQNNFNDND